MLNTRFQIILGVLLSVTAGLVLFWDSQLRINAFKERHTGTMMSSVQSLNMELSNSIARLQKLARLFSVEQSKLIDKVYDAPLNLELRYQLEQKVSAYFPDFLAFTVADDHGEPVLSDNTGLIGKGCRADLSGYADIAFEALHVHTPYMHFNPMSGGFARHFDLMVPWNYSAKGVFFVSIQDKYLQKSMLRFEKPGFELLLLRSDKHSMVELGASEGILKDKTKRELTADEITNLQGEANIAGTLWNSAAMPMPGYIDEQVTYIQQKALIIWFIWVVVITGLILLIRYEGRRNTELQTLNSSLNEEVRVREQTEEELRQLVDYDPLTTLPNRKSAYDFLTHALAVARKQDLKPAVFFFDIDRFSDFNDSLGHGYGDVMLKEAAQRLKSLVSTEDMLARWGGDEFLVILQHVEDNNQLAHFAETLIEAMRRPIALHRSKVVATISLGIATYPDSGEDLETLLKNADLAMFRAKNEGRDCYRFFIQEMDDIISERLRLESDIREGVTLSEFEPWYQPRIDMKTGKVVGAEVLMRWHHREKGVLSPAKFLSTVDETGLIDTVGDMVRSKVCAQCVDWQDRGIRTGIISVNLSGREFFRADIIDHLNSAILSCGLKTEKFEIEITENHLMGNTAESLGKLHALKHMGFRLAVDDFGTGYSSLAYLKRFPVDIVKIDQAFVKDCVSNPEDQDILRAIINLAHSLSLRVVAEGVEHISQMEILRSMKCDELQGYLVAKPMMASDFETFVTEGSHHLPTA